MFKLTDIPHNSHLQRIVDIVKVITQTDDDSFVKVVAAYYLTKMSSNMRVSVQTKDRGNIPINIYVIGLATSGFGKGHTVNIIEKDIMQPFIKRFTTETFPIVSENNLVSIASERSIRRNTSGEEELAKVEKEFNACGEFIYSFAEGTSPALKQYRHKLILSSLGAINLIIDEIGSNLGDNVDLLNSFLELFDKGEIRDKLIKNTAESKRFEQVFGHTPCNLLMFGTPIKLFDGAKTEEAFFSFLETGYARRCFFGVGIVDKNHKKTDKTAEELFNAITDSHIKNEILLLSTEFYDLADPTLANKVLFMSDEVNIKSIEYKLHCEDRARYMPEYDEVRKAEMVHRYYKSIKLAGALSYAAGLDEVDMQRLLEAIKFTEEAGLSFERMVNQEKSYMKLARHIADSESELTHSDLTEKLAFYPKASNARHEMLIMAKSWGYKEHIVIRAKDVDGITFFSGESLKKTDLNNLILSYSNHEAYNYMNKNVKFTDLSNLTKRSDLHWINHHVEDKHRLEDKVIPGFNMVVLDVDDGSITVDQFKEEFKEYAYLLYTTKRHTEDKHRFRVIFPTNYVLNLDSITYKEFMQNLSKWLPFTIDTGAIQRCRKWIGNNAATFINEGDMLLDVLPFIPNTSKNDAFNTNFSKIADMTNLERWYASQMVEGNRNNILYRFGAHIADNGVPLSELQETLHNFNNKLDNPISADRLNNTVIKSLAEHKYRNKEGK